MSGKRKPPPARKAGETDAGSASARARALRDERVRRVVSLMAHGKWNGAASHLDLAAQWDVSRHAVADYAREASGIIRNVLEGDPDEIRAEIVAGIDAVRRLALRLVRPMRVGADMYEDRPTPHIEGALRAYELRAKMLGVMPSEKVDMTVKDVRELTPAEEVTEIDKVIEELRERRAELAAVGNETSGELQ